MYDKSIPDYLQYDPQTGNITYKETHATMKHGRIAGSKGVDGYRYVVFNKKEYLEHRLVWFLYYGEILTGQLDHINHDRSDNRICNLRLATNSENSMNKNMQSNNTSGFKGVTWHKQTKKFQAKICKNGHRYSLGYYDNPEDASIAYQNAAKELHREFARY